jgi:hypothetical protein
LKLCKGFAKVVITSEGIEMKTKTCSCGIIYEAKLYASCPVCRWSAAVKPILAIVRSFNTRIREVV